MNAATRRHLETIAQKLIDAKDAPHDFEHARRVMNNALRIGATVHADEDVLIPAALFHDVVMYPKNDPRSSGANAESAEMAAEILSSTDGYPQEKIPQVVTAIEQCSFSNRSQDIPTEALVLQDADRLEVTGAIAIMRTFWSAGQMQHPLYDPNDPFATSRTPDGLEYALDLFFTRLLCVSDRMNTSAGKEIALERTSFLESFLTQFKREVDDFPHE